MSAAVAEKHTGVTVGLLTLAWLCGCDRPGDIRVEELGTAFGVIEPQALVLRCRNPGRIIVTVDLPGGDTFVKCVATVPPPKAQP